MSSCRPSLCDSAEIVLSAGARRRILEGLSARWRVNQRGHSVWTDRLCFIGPLSGKPDGFREQCVAGFPVTAR